MYWLNIFSGQVRDNRMTGELDENWKYGVDFRASLDGLDLLDVWRSSVEWVEENGWEITDRRYGEFIRFNHVRETSKGESVRKAEIHLTDTGEGLSLEFKVERRTVFDHEIYLKVVDDFLKHVGVQMSKQELAELYYKGYIIEYAVNLYDVNSRELWDSTVQWINNKKWKVHEIRENEYIHFDLISGVGSGTNVREAEICFSDSDGGLTVEFKVQMLSIVEDTEIRYKRKAQDYFTSMGISLGKQDYSRLFSESDLNIIIRNDMLFILMIVMFPSYMLIVGIERLFDYFFAFFIYSWTIPLIINVTHYTKLKNWLYNE